jgi:hypothetical protein
MKINELVGYKEKPEYKLFKSPPVQNDKWTRNLQLKAIVNKLNELGYEQYEIGNGYYSQVYARPQDNYVIKIFRHDPGYMAFLEHIKSNLNNPYVPKLKGKIIKLPNNFSLVRIEKLQPMKLKLFDEIHDAVYDESKKTVIEVENKYPRLIDFMRSLLKLPKNNKEIDVDLHLGNMMMRGDTPVVIDPFYSLHA